MLSVGILRFVRVCGFWKLNIFVMSKIHIFLLHCEKSFFNIYMQELEKFAFIQTELNTRQDLIFSLHSIFSPLLSEFLVQSFLQQQHCDANSNYSRLSINISGKFYQAISYQLAHNQKFLRCAYKISKKFKMFEFQFQF